MGFLNFYQAQNIKESVEYDIVGAIIYGGWARGDGVRWELDLTGSIILSDRKEVKTLMSGRDGLIGDQFRIVTPYSEVREALMRVTRR